jgi:hypothetical protein
MPPNEQRTPEMAIAHANESMPRRPRDQGHGSTTTLNSEPPLRLPCTTQQAGTSCQPATARKMPGRLDDQKRCTASPSILRGTPPPRTCRRRPGPPRPNRPATHSGPPEAAPSPAKLDAGPSIRGLRATSAPKSRRAATSNYLFHLKKLLAVSSARNNNN